jgi:hypothetical protein
MKWRRIWRWRISGHEESKDEDDGGKKRREMKDEKK